MTTRHFLRALLHPRPRAILFAFGLLLLPAAPGCVAPIDQGEAEPADDVGGSAGVLEDDEVETITQGIAKATAAPRATATVTIDPGYVAGSTSFVAIVKVTARVTLNAGWGLQFHVPEGGLASDNTRPYVRAISDPSGARVTTRTDGGRYEIRASGAASVLAAGSSRTFRITIAGNANPGLNAPHRFFVHQTKSNGSEVFNGKLFRCPVPELFDHFAYGRSQHDKSSFDDGTAQPPIYSVRGSDFLLATNYINTTVGYAGTQIEWMLAEGKVPYAYTYTTAFQARTQLGLRDCNVRYTKDTAHTLCERGATWLRIAGNVAKLVGYYEGIGTSIQKLVDAARTARLPGAKKVLLHVEPDWIQYTYGGISFEPGYDAQKNPDTSCRTATIRNQDPTGASAPNTVRTIAMGAASKEFEQRFLYRSKAEDPVNFDKTPYFSYQYDATAKRCRLSDAFQKAHPTEKALTVAESRAIIQPMLRALKKTCRDCVLVMDASTSMSPTFMNAILEGLESDMVPYVGITGGVISPHSGKYNEFLGENTYKRSYADYYVETGKKIFIITNMGATDYQRAWSERKTVQAMWNSGVAGVLVSAWPEHETFMTPGSPTYLGAVRSLGTPPSPTNLDNWFPGWTFSRAGIIGGSWGPQVWVTAPPGALAKTVSVELIDSATKVKTSYEMTTNAEQATSPLTDIPANGYYSKRNVRTVVDPMMVFTAEDTRGNKVKLTHFMDGTKEDIYEVQ